MTIDKSQAFDALQKAVFEEGAIDFAVIGEVLGRTVASGGIDAETWFDESSECIVWGDSSIVHGVTFWTPDPRTHALENPLRTRIASAEHVRRASSEASAG